MNSIDRFLNVDLDEEVTAPLEWPPMIKHLSATSIGMFRRC